MNLPTIARRIQYQVAKIEVLEYIFSWTRKNNPSLEVEVCFNVITTVKDGLFKESEACIDVLPGKEIIAITSLQNTLITANSYLTEMYSGNSVDLGFLLIKGLVTDVVSALLNLNSELNILLNSLQESKSVESAVETYQATLTESLNDVDESIDSTELLYKSLITKCLGDTQKAERLIQYELNRSFVLTREGAIQSAIHRWERDNG